MSKDTHPRVSIGMPVYNAERYLEQALDAILGQTFADFELVVSDNGSTDGTQRICESRATKDHRIRYVRNAENIGVIGNFNRVFALSTGEYFKWASSDDICGPDYLRNAVSVLDADPSVVLVWGKTIGIDEAGNRVEHPSEVSDLNSAISVYSPDPVVRFRRLMTHMWWVDGPLHGVIRSRVLRNIHPHVIRDTHPHPAHMSGDQILLTALVLQGRFYEIPEDTFFSRVHSGKTSRVATLAERARVVDPNADLTGLGRWRLVSGYPERIAMYLAIIARAPITGRQKAACDWEVMRTLAWWTRLRVSQLLPDNKLADLVRPSPNA